MKNLVILTLISGILTVFSSRLFAQETGILNQAAPSLHVTEWRNLPSGKTAIDIQDLKGKVVYLFCFQNW
ncbi:MAG: hypothetical protein HQM13_08695 [SAR324 cluster bacterium]|nr:hypothetical protein [SAR324 cluster bacterium]